MTLFKAYEGAFGVYVPIILDAGRVDVTLHFYTLRGSSWYPDESVYNNEEDVYKKWEYMDEYELSSSQGRLLLEELFKKFVWEEV